MTASKKAPRKRAADNNQTDSEQGRGDWWRSAFFAVGTVYVTLLLIGQVLGILGGFVQIGLTVFMAWLLAFILAPLVGLIERRRWMPRSAAIALVYAATGVISGLVLFYVASSVGASMGELATNFPDTRERITAALREWEGSISLGRFSPDLVALFGDVEATVGRLATSALGEAPAVTMAVLGGLVLVIILSLYMLADSAGILAKLHRVVPARYADHAELLERSVASAFGGFLRAQITLAFVQAALTLIVVLVAGLPYGMIVIVASALAMLIPFFGPPLALIPPLVAVAIYAPGHFIIAVPALLITQTALVNYLQPRLMRDALGMHPLLVLVGLLVGAQVAGLWGALFALPVLAVLNVFVNYAINLRALDEDPDTDVEDALDEVRAEDPNATQEEIAAIAADRVDKELLRGDNQMSDTASTEHAEDLSEDPALTHPRDHELGYHGPHDVRCDTCDARLTAAHDCAEFAQHFVNRGDESHGLECGRCGAFIQGG